MADAPSFEDYFRIARDTMLSRNSKLTREVIEREGTDTNSIVAAIAAVGDDLSAQLVRAQGSMLLSVAKKKDLDRLVFDRCSGMTRKPASQALGTVLFSTTAPSPSTFSIPKGVKLQTSDGKEFITWVDATFNVGSTGPVAVEVRSVFPGLENQARIGTITSVVTPIVGAPTDLRVTNTVATTGADDEETDDQLRARARLFFTTARRGTLPAIEFAARGVAGVRTATAFEGQDQLGRPARFVNLIVTDAFTEALMDLDPTPASYQSQSQTLANQVFNALSDTRAAGIFVQVQVASVVMQAVTLGLRFYAGSDADTVAMNARGVIAAYINSLAPGQDLTIANMIQRLRTVSGLDVTGQEILSPAGDVNVAPLQVLRSSSAIVVATSVQPDRTLQGSNNPDAPAY